MVDPADCTIDLASTMSATGSAECGVPTDKTDTVTTAGRSAVWPLERTSRTTKIFVCLFLGALLVVSVTGGLLLTSNGAGMDSGPAVCGELSVAKQGRVNLIFDNLPTDLLRRERRTIEDLFVNSYNQVSGMCDGLFERVLLDSTMVDWRDVSGEGALTTTSWTAFVNCSGCPDAEPLFVGGSEKRRRLQENSHIYNYEATNDFFYRFTQLMNLYLSEFFNITQGGIVLVATINVESGEVDQVFSLLPETHSPSNRPSSEPTVSPESGQGNQLFSLLPETFPQSNRPPSEPTTSPDAI